MALWKLKLNPTLSIDESIRSPFIASYGQRRSAAGTCILRLPRSFNRCFSITAAVSSSPSSSNTPHTSISPVKSAVCALIFAAAAFGNFNRGVARAKGLWPFQTLTENRRREDEVKQAEGEALVEMLVQIRHASEVIEDLLGKLSASDFELQFCISFYLDEIGRVEAARDEMNTILSKIPSVLTSWVDFSLLDRARNSEEIMRRLQESLKSAQRWRKAKEARDAKLRIAQMHFLDKNYGEALRMYSELILEDPSDCRPYFCKAYVYGKMGKTVEAKEQLVKYRELSSLIDEEGYFRTPMDWLKVPVISLD